MWRLSHNMFLGSGIFQNRRSKHFKNTVLGNDVLGNLCFWKTVLLNLCWGIHFGKPCFGNLRVGGEWGVVPGNETRGGGGRRRSFHGPDSLSPRWAPTCQFTQTKHIDKQKKTNIAKGLYRVYKRYIVTCPKHGRRCQRQRGVTAPFRSLHAWLP